MESSDRGQDESLVARYVAPASKVPIAQSTHSIAEMLLDQRDGSVLENRSGGFPAPTAAKGKPLYPGG